jgi:hypothetical protein
LLHNFSLWSFSDVIANVFPVMVRRVTGPLDRFQHSNKF